MNESDKKRIGLVINTEFDDLVKEVASINGITNKSLMIRTMCYDYVVRNHNYLLSTQ